MKLVVFRPEGAQGTRPSPGQGVLAAALGFKFTKRLAAL